MSLASKSLRASILLAALSSACGNGFVYDPPPEPELVFPETGSFIAGDTLELTFSESIDPATLKLRVWQTELDTELEIPDSAKPVIETCTISDGSCGDLTISATGSNPKSVSLVLDAEGIGRPGTPLILEVEPGLADKAGRATGRSIYYNVQFIAPEGTMNEDVVEFVEGTYIFSAVVSKPVPAVLTLISDVKVTPDGRIFIAGGEGDEINGAPKDTIDPENLIVDPTEEGWALHLRGQVTLTEDGRRVMTTEPVDATLPSQPFNIDLTQVRMNGEIVRQDDGTEKFQGTLSFEKLIAFNDDIMLNPLKGGTEPLVGVFVPAEKEPAGVPKLCGDQCGAIVAVCEPPMDFPDEDVCMDAEE